MIEYSNLDPFGYNKKESYDPIKCAACRVAVEKLTEWTVEELKITDYITGFATNVCVALDIFEDEVC